ncbi:MAG TPA: hypothetical protein VD886_09835 [Herpetosiphonaceae bacterium]|nr:hypothetical protein [Herpetosiphonaceae bacterium]
MVPSSLNQPAVLHNQGKRNVQEVPFVELSAGRLQGVVSSGSDIQRVYVAYFEARTLNFHCSTNNNRPCGGLRGRPCKHLTHLLAEAVKQFGAEGVARYLQCADDAGQINGAPDLLRRAGVGTGQPYGEIFSRFLASLQLLEIPASSLPVPEMDWFSGGS